jgi:hypothetical protein
MSKGPGTVEKRITELFVATDDRALSVADIAAHAFELAGRPASREQRLSATRAAHRLIRRMKETRKLHRRLINEAHREAEAAFGRKPRYGGDDSDYDEYWPLVYATSAWQHAQKLYSWAEQFGSWSTFVKVDRDSFRLDREEFGGQPPRWPPLFPPARRPGQRLCGNRLA